MVWATTSDIDGYNATASDHESSYNRWSRDNISSETCQGRHGVYESGGSRDDYVKTIRIRPSQILCGCETTPSIETRDDEKSTDLMTATPVHVLSEIDGRRYLDSIPYIERYMRVNSSTIHFETPPSSSCCARYFTTNVNGEECSWQRVGYVPGEGPDVPDPWVILQSMTARQHIEPGRRVRGDTRTRLSRDKQAVRTTRTQ